MKSLIWFRDDLRINDNPALASGENITALYILEDEGRPLGGASRRWLHHSLTALQTNLKARNIQLVLAKGKALPILETLIDQHGFTHVAWNRRYSKAGIETDKAIKATLKAEVKSFSGSLLKEPWEIKPYKVFTPFWRFHQSLPDRQVIKTPRLTGNVAIPSLELNDLQLLPKNPDWAAGFTWIAGEQAAIDRLSDFIDNGLKGYATGRDRPDLSHVSRLSPYLRFGEISPTQIFHALSFIDETADVIKFKTEIGWRDFAYHLLYHYPDLAWKNFNPKFDTFPYEKNDVALLLWQQGKTGYPIVDAGMRELWQTGYMHNRVRMICASFLIKHLLIDWREGENRFWDCLLDADPANNAASWQWVAGSGADAAPYYRIFNPIIQGEKFDPNGDYVRRFVPEIAHLPNNLIHKPQKNAIISHEFARARALSAFKGL